MLRMLFLAVVALPAVLLADDWQLLTDIRNVRDMVSIGDDLWLATEGGLVEFSPQSGLFKSYNTLDGLGGVAVSKLEKDGEGGLWIGFDNRMIQRWVPGEGVTHSIPTLSQQPGIQAINDLQIDPRGLFVATSRGVALITYSEEYDQWVWFDEYRRLGTRFDPDIPARAIWVEGDTLWVATDQGIAKGNLNSPPPLDWTNITRASVLPSNEIRDIIRVKDTLYVSTSGGAARFTFGRWRKLEERNDVYRLSAHRDTLYATTSDGISWWSGTNWQRIGPLKLGVKVVVWDADDNLWAGFPINGISPGGLATLTDNTWMADIPASPSSNIMRAALFKSDGSSYFAGGRSAGEYGVASLDDGEWENWTAPTYSGAAFGYIHRSLAEDDFGGVWAGTAGGGVAWYKRDGSIAIFSADSASGYRLRGYPLGPTQALASAVAADGNGNIWIVNRGADNGNILACVPRSFTQNPHPDSSWFYFHRSNFRAFEEFDLLTIDGRGRKWIASTANNPSIAADQGVYVLEDRGTLRDSTDDRIWGPLPGLPSAEVLSLKWDPAGYVWAGSSRGAYYINATVSDLTGYAFVQVYNMREIPILAIDVDPAGNKWFGTEFGVSILSPDLFTIVRRITADSPDRLPSARIQMIAVDPYSGWAYLGTNDGTVALRTPYRDYGVDIVELSFEPNPFDPNHQRLVFTGNALAGGAGASIFTPDGRLIIKMSHDEAALGWDGRDEQGNHAADGVYMILTYNSSGQAGKGKVALLRR